MRHLVAIIALTVVIGLFPGTSKAGEPETPTITFALLEKTVFNNTPPPKFPAELSKLEGKRVRLSGFVTPYDDPENLAKMVLVKSPGGCFFCGPSAATAVVLVRRVPSDPVLKNLTDPVEVEGILHLWRAKMKNDDEAKGFLFTIDEARVRVKKK